MTKQLAKAETGKGGDGKVLSFYFAPQSFKEAEDYAKVVAESGLVPTAYKGKPQDILVAWQYGAELGVQPLQALQGIAVINGRPCVWGDLALAVVQASGTVEHMREYFDEKTQTAYFEAKRKGNKETIRQAFSFADAKTAGLSGKQGPWQNYPKRMCQMRARGFGLRDGWADFLKGMSIREEVQDYVTVEQLDSKTSLVEPRRASAATPAPEAGAPQGDHREGLEVRQDGPAFQKGVVDKVTGSTIKDESVYYVYLSGQKYYTKNEDLAKAAKEQKGNEIEFTIAEANEIGVELVEFRVPTVA